MKTCLSVSKEKGYQMFASKSEYRTWALSSGPGACVQDLRCVPFWVRPSETVSFLPGNKDPSLGVKGDRLSDVCVQPPWQDRMGLKRFWVSVWRGSWRVRWFHKESRLQLHVARRLTEIRTGSPVLPELLPAAACQLFKSFCFGWFRLLFFSFLSPPG